MKKLHTITIPPLSGKKLIKDSKLFSWIDPDFVNYGASEAGSETEAGNFDVLELTKDMTFKEMFQENQAMTQEQILYFVENHKEKLKQDNYAIFFLFKSEGNFFVAYVNVNPDGLNVNVNRFENSFVWDAGGGPRFVVPQLADTLSLNPLDLDQRVKQLESDMEKIKKIINL